MSAEGAGVSRAVVVVGSANADLVIEVPRRPVGGETLLGGDLQLHPGGKGANQAAAAARSGARVAFAASVGADANGAYLREQLASAGVDIGSVVESDRPTGTAVIFLTPDGENSIVVSPGANQALDIDTVERARAVWGSAAVVVLSLEIPLETATHVAANAAASGARIVLNAAPAARLAPETLALCDPLIVNEHEALDVLGLAEDHPDAGDYERLAGLLIGAGARSAVITVGAEGAVVADGGSITRTPAYRVPVVDTTGAGDAFVGATAAELAAGAGLADAVRFATAVSAVSVQRVGAQSSYASRADVEAFIASRG